MESDHSLQIVTLPVRYDYYCYWQSNLCIIFVFAFATLAHISKICTYLSLTAAVSWQLRLSEPRGGTALLCRQPGAHRSVFGLCTPHPAALGRHPSPSVHPGRALQHQLLHLPALWRGKRLEGCRCTHTAHKGQRSSSTAQWIYPPNKLLCSVRIVWKLFYQHFNSKIMKWKNENHVV